MPQNVLVSVLGEGKYLTALVRAILEKNIIPTRFLFLSAKNEASLQAAEGYDVTVCEDELSAVIKSEIVLVTASRREMPTELAKISSSSQKRVVVSVCDSDKVDLAYLSERIVAATELWPLFCIEMRRQTDRVLRGEQARASVPVQARHATSSTRCARC